MTAASINRPFKVPRPASSAHFDNSSVNNERMSQGAPSTYLNTFTKTYHAEREKRKKSAEFVAKQATAARRQAGKALQPTGDEDIDNHRQTAAQEEQDIEETVERHAGLVHGEPEDEKTGADDVTAMLDFAESLKQRNLDPAVQAILMTGFLKKKVRSICTDNKLR